MIDAEAIRDRFTALLPHLDERGRRVFAASEARAAGYGGIAVVARVTGIAASTIGRGLDELAGAARLDEARCRRRGGGRKPLTALDASLLDDLLALVSPSERGDPMSPLRWTCKSLRRLAAELAQRGHRVSHTVVGKLLKQQKFSLQANRKTREGDDHPDRNAQFEHINRCLTEALAGCQPVISVDTKKKELVRDFKNGGREWRPRGDPEEVRVHDFLIEELGRAVPYGIYDLAANAGWVSVGMDHDTSAFAVQTTRRWWHDVGAARYPDARRLTITADGGGSNASRSRQWKRELQGLANELGIEVAVHHLPPGTSKWNKHRAPPVLVQQHELAGQAAGELPRHRRSDRRHHDRHRPDGALQTRHRALSQRHHRDRPGDGGDQHRPWRLPRGVELHHQTEQPLRSSG